MNILFVGGGTLGPVTPLLATAEQLKRQAAGISFAWIGTPDGPERALVERAGMSFYALPIAKWPRYPSVRWLTFPFDWMRARSAAARLVRRLKPDAVVSAGGFTAVPVITAAAKKGIPCFAHQLDVVPSLSNRQIARLCASVTTSFEYERPPFGDRVSDDRIATPTRFQLKDAPTRHEAAKRFGLDAERPVVLVFGGGTGSQRLNDLVTHNKRRWLSMAQIIHVTGIGKQGDAKDGPGYVVRPLIDKDWAAALALADLVIGRAGVGGLSEIAALKKAAILVPLPGQQEANAAAFEAHGAAVVIDQDADAFAEEVLTDAAMLLADKEARRSMGEQAHAFFPTDDGTALATRILKVMRQTPRK